MVINNPTNDQVVDVVAHNLSKNESTNIDFGGFEFWTYPSGDILRSDNYGDYESNIDELIKYMSKYPVKEVY